MPDSSKSVSDNSGTVQVEDEVDLGGGHFYDHSLDIMSYRD